MNTSVIRSGISALLLLFTAGNIMAAGEEPDNGIKAFIRSYWHLRMEGCQPSTLEKLRQALPGVKDRDAAILGSTLYALGVASAGNHQTYYATYKAVVAADPRTPYLEYLVGNSVSENCGTCEGSGESKVNCGGCGGKGTFVGFQGVSHPCPKCRGQGTLPIRCATCQGQRTVFSPKHAATSFDKLLRVAEGKLVNTYGDLLGFLDEPLRSQVAEMKAEEALQEKAYTVSLELAQVTSEGALAYVLNSYPRILIFVKDLESGVADGERWSGKLWLIGTHRYVTRADYEKTVKMFTASKVVATNHFKNKEGQSEPVATPGSPANTSPVAGSATAAMGNPFVNSLGMKFVAVPGTQVLFSIWDTRVPDYQAFVNATARSWGEFAGMKITFKRGPMDPAVMVSWEDAKAFCKWLTQRELSEGRLQKGQQYRLPTDAEWSVAVGLPPETGGTPKEKSMKIKDVYPWGNQWPPPRGAGNYEPSLAVDDFENTSPVGSFAANQLGLYDMGGNVLQWCEDFFDGQSGKRVVRGASWTTPPVRNCLLSSCRLDYPPDYCDSYFGFRCVLAGAGGLAEPTLKPTAQDADSKPPSAATESGSVANKHTQAGESHGVKTTGPGVLGITAGAINEERTRQYRLTQTTGVMIVRVTQGSPAERANIQVGDVVLSYNQQPVVHVKDLTESVRATQPNTRVLLTLNRQGKVFTAEVTIGSSNDAAVRPTDTH